MTLFAEIRARSIRRAVAVHEAASMHMDVRSDPAQLDRFNNAWAESLRRSPWARAMRAQLNLPDRFADWSSLATMLPVQRKADLRIALEAASERSDEAVVWRATGGTTAEPLRFPTFASEARVAELDHWLGRGRLGIDPADRLFLLWGHAHLFGVGLKGSLAMTKRRLADAALGYVRWSAYRLAEADLGRAAIALVNSRASYVIGYSSALDRFVRVNAGRASEFRRLGLKAVIATAEAFPTAQSRDLIADCFGAPIVMEYGSVETGPLAYESVDRQGFDVFTRHYRLELSAAPGRDGAAELLVTSLYPRALPLLRYAIGDLAVPSEPDDGRGGLARLARVIGRSNDAVTSLSGTPIHSEAFTHVLRDVPGLTAYQIVRGEGGLARRILYEAVSPLCATEESDVRRRLSLIDPSLAGLALERVDRLERSVAGKSLMVVNED